MVPGMGGAMDLVTGAKRVIVAEVDIRHEGDMQLIEEIGKAATTKRRFGSVKCGRMGRTPIILGARL
jgi:acyl CoA:acetate/3-ketoacid CoA transferase beta subunit